MPKDWSPRWTKTPEGLKEALQWWLKTHGMDKDTRVYTHDEWRKRGETIGNEALVSIASEGLFYDFLNRAEAWDGRTERDYQAFIKRLGLFQERGFSWSVHFYPEQEIGPALGANAPEGKSLFRVLGEIAFVRPRIVFMKGGQRYLIEELLQAARRLIKSASPEAVIVHRTPSFTWSYDTKGKLVIWQEDARGRRPVYAEPGSEVVT
jgi:hypothetical protein